MNLVFDVGNVLLRWDPAGLVRTIWPQANPVHAVDSLFGAGHWPALDAGTIPFDEAVAAGAKAGGFGTDEVADFYGRIPALLEPVSEIVDRLAHLAERDDTRLFVLSNMPDYMRQVLISKHTFFECFERCVFSCDVLCNKPDAAIYRALLEGCDLNAGETLFIDDREENLHAAEAFGMSTLLLPDGAGSDECERIAERIVVWRPS